MSGRVASRASPSREARALHIAVRSAGYSPRRSPELHEPAKETDADEPLIRPHPPFAARLAAAAPLAMTLRPARAAGDVYVHAGANFTPVSIAVTPFVGDDATRSAR